MKKTIVLIVSLLLGSMVASAQLDNMLKKAAKKVGERVLNSATDGVKSEDADYVSENEFSVGTDQSQTEPLTYRSLMEQMPELPTPQQYVSFIEAQRAGQTLKILASPVNKFYAKVLALSSQSFALVNANVDSAQAVKMMEQYTGLSAEDMQRLSAMSEEEQQAYLEAHYQQGKAESVLIEQTQATAQYLEPIQPLIDQWDAIENRIISLYSDVDSRCAAIYAKYADRLGATKDKEREKILLQYYAEILPDQIAAVKQAMDIRLNEQLAIAEQIEEMMVSIRAEHQNYISSLLNYPQLTATQYFNEHSRLSDIVEYGEE